MLLNSKLVGVIGPSITDLDACRANRKSFESTDEVTMAAVRISFAVTPSRRRQCKEASALAAGLESSGAERGRHLT